MTPVSLSPRLHLASVFSPGLHAPPAPTLQPGGRRFPTPSRLAVCTSLGLSDPPPLGLFIGDHKPPDSVSSRSVYESGTFRPSTPGGVGVFPLGSWRQDTAIRILPPTPRGVHEPARVGGNPMTGVSIGGGVRKSRIAREGGGKSGGYRVIHFFSPEDDTPIFEVWRRKP